MQAAGRSDARKDLAKCIMEARCIFCVLSVLPRTAASRPLGGTNAKQRRASAPFTPSSPPGRHLCHGAHPNLNPSPCLPGTSSDWSIITLASSMYLSTCPVWPCVLVCINPCSVDPKDWRRGAAKRIWIQRLGLNQTQETIMQSCD